MKRRTRGEPKLSLDEFQAQYGKGYNRLEDFLYEFDTIGDWSAADPAELERLYWHVERIAKSINGYMSHEFRTMDEAFQVRRPDGYRQPSARKRYLHMRNLQDLGLKLRKRGAVTDNQFFEFLGRMFNVDKTLAAEWYYQKHRGAKPDPTLDNSDIPEWARDQINWRR